MKYYAKQNSHLDVGGSDSANMAASDSGDDRSNSLAGVRVYKLLSPPEEAELRLMKGNLGVDGAVG